MKTKVLLKLSEAMKKFDGEWIAFKKVEKGEDPKGEVLVHHKDEDTFDKLIVEKNAINCTIKYCWDETDENHPLNKKVFLL